MSTEYEYYAELSGLPTDSGPYTLLDHKRAYFESEGFSTEYEFLFSNAATLTDGKSFNDLALAYWKDLSGLTEKLSVDDYKYFVFSTGITPGPNYSKTLVNWYSQIASKGSGSLLILGDKQMEGEGASSFANSYISKLGVFSDNIYRPPFYKISEGWGNWYSSPTAFSPGGGISGYKKYALISTGGEVSYPMSGYSYMIYHPLGTFYDVVFEVFEDGVSVGTANMNGPNDTAYLSVFDRGGVNSDFTLTIKHYSGTDDVQINGLLSVNNPTTYPTTDFSLTGATFGNYPKNIGDFPIEVANQLLTVVCLGIEKFINDNNFSTKLNDGTLETDLKAFIDYYRAQSSSWAEILVVGSHEASIANPGTIWADYRKMMKDVCKSKGVAYLDMVDAGMTPDKTEYYDTNGQYLNDTGHATFASNLMNVLIPAGS